MPQSWSSGDNLGLGATAGRERDGIGVQLGPTRCAAAVAASAVSSWTSQLPPAQTQRVSDHRDRAETAAVSSAISCLARRAPQRSAPLFAATPAMPGGAA